MAKKKAKKAAPKAAAKKATKKAPAKKAPAKKAPKKKAKAAKAKAEPQVEVDPWEAMDLDPPVKAAFDLLNASAAVGDELEGAAQDALAGAVKSVFAKHAVELTEDQAMIVTLALFSDADEEDEDIDE